MQNRLAIPSSLKEAAIAKMEVMNAVESFGFDSNMIFAVRLAIDEALTNAVRHGNREDPTKQVIIEYDVSPQRVKIVVEDEGTGFDPTGIADPTAQENLDRPHGRGIMLMKAYMTDVSFNDRGNRVTMLKDRDCHLPHHGSG